MEENKMICAECGKEIDVDEEVYELSNGEFICESCYESDYITCEECGDIIPYDDAISVNDDTVYVCEYCAGNASKYYQCVCCGKWFTTRYRDAYNDYEGNDVCQECVDTEYSSCCVCDELFLRDDMIFDVHTERFYCPDCERYNKKAIHDYGYKPEPKYKTHEHDEFWTDESIRELLFGVELEIDKGDDPEETAEEIIEACEDVYCKHDGSLSDGVEIVSHPCTLEYHLKDLGWDTISDIALSHDFKSHNARTCGLHIHVGRRQLGCDTDERRETASKIAILIWRHWESVLRFSRRNDEQLRWAEKPELDSAVMQRDAIRAVYNDVYNSGRYKAVNFSNSNTIEFRIYNGTLRVPTLYATLQFTSNVCKYAMAHTLKECLASQWLDVAMYEQLPELADYLCTRGLDNVPYIEPIDRERMMNSEDSNSFKIGDRVRIVNSCGNDVPALSNLIHCEATVVCYKKGTFDYGIDFGEYYSGLHELNSHLPECTGYWVHACNIELVTD